MRPNILLLFPDQLRAEWINRKSDEIPLCTQGVDRLAEHGIIFTRAVSPSPLCAPARAVLASGRRYHRAGVRDNGENFPLEIPTFYQSLRDSGYSVLGCGKFDLHKPDFTWGKKGKAFLKEWGFSNGVDSEGKLDGIAAFRKKTAGPYLEYLNSQGIAEMYVTEMEKRGAYGTVPTFLNQDQYGDNWVLGNGKSLIEKADPEKPWFMQINFPGPHLPFDITEDMALKQRSRRFPLPETNKKSDIDHLSIRRNYASMIENIDCLILEFLNFLESRGDLDNTIIILSSDHGEMLGDRDCYGKCLPYNPAVEIPLIISGPEVGKGLRNSSPVELTDLAATCLEIAGLSQETAMDSVSLCPVLFSGADSIRDTAGSSLQTADQYYQDWRMAVDRDYKLIQWGDNSLELYTLEDYHEKKNIAEDLPDVANRLLKKLPPWLDTYELTKYNKNGRYLYEKT